MKKDERPPHTRPLEPWVVRDPHRLFPFATEERVTVASNTVALMAWHDPVSLRPMAFPPQLHEEQARLWERGFLSKVCQIAWASSATLDVTFSALEKEAEDGSSRVKEALPSRHVVPSIDSRGA